MTGGDVAMLAGNVLVLVCAVYVLIETLRLNRRRAARDAARQGGVVHHAIITGGSMGPTRYQRLPDTPADSPTSRESSTP